MADLRLPEVNECRFVGRVIRDPELKHIANGTAVLKFSIACDRRYKKGTESVKEAVFPSIVVWGKHAEYLADNMKKGIAVQVRNARMDQRKWKNKEGVDQHSTEYVVDGMYSRVDILEWASDRPAPYPAPHTPTGPLPDIPSYGPPDEAEDIPF